MRSELIPSCTKGRCCLADLAAMTNRAQSHARNLLEPSHRLRYGVKGRQERAQEGTDPEGECDGAQGAQRGRLRQICSSGTDAESEREEVIHWNGVTQTFQPLAPVCFCISIMLVGE